MTDTQNAVVEWNPESGAALPAYLTGAMEDLGSNIADRNRVPSLSYEGKVWQIVKDGERTKLTVTNSDGDVVPVPVMRMVVLNYNPERGRAYYEGEYDPSTTTAPVCWSADGKAPDASVQTKKAAACATCPMSVKGSKIRDGKEMVACGAHRMLAIAPAFDLAADPLRLKIAVTSDYDKEIVEHGWFAWRQYADYLKSRGITHTAMVVTKVKFDNTVAYPKLLFALDRLLTPAEVATVREAMKNEKINGLLNEKWTPAGVDGVPSDDSDIRPRPEDPNHYHAAGTPEELWWDDRIQQWVKPWVTEAEKPAAPPPPPPAEEKIAEPVQDVFDPIEAARADGWVPHPDAPGYHYKGQEVVADMDLIQRYMAGNVAAPTAGAAEPASTPELPAASQSTAPAAQAEPEPVTVQIAEVQPDPLAAAVADGWVPHPDAPGYHYKGQEVVADADLAARYSPAAATATTAPAGDTPEVPAEVKKLLNKWTG